MSADSPDARALHLMCPSAQPEMADAVILGVREATSDGPLISYLQHPVPVTTELLV